MIICYAIAKMIAKINILNRRHKYTSVWTSKLNEYSVLKFV